MKSIACAIVVLFACVQIGSSIKCYNGPIHNTTKITCNNGSCLKAINTTVSTGKKEIWYGCDVPKHSEEKCMDISQFQGVGEDDKYDLLECFCNTDLCNSSTTVAFNMLSLLVALLVAKVLIM